MNAEPERRPINQWSEDDRPREKMLKKGAKALSTAELLAILIRSGTKKLSALDIAKTILHEVNNDLGRLGELEITTLMKYTGIKEAKAITIAAALELGRRRQSQKVLKRPQFTSARIVYDYVAPEMADSNVELFKILFLNRANYLIHEIELSRGGTSGTYTEPADIFRNAVRIERCKAIIVCHNHPSGNKQPSQADINITQRIKKCGEILGINLIDHLIIVRDDYFSFSEAGML